MDTHAFAPVVDLPKEQRTQPVDPLLQQYAEAQRKQREAIAEMRRLRPLMRIGTCEVCGAEFTRARVTKRVCSQACTIRAYSRRLNSKRHPSSLERIREALPLMKAGGLMTARALALVDMALGTTAAVVESEAGVSRQYIDQVLGQALKIAKTVLFMKAAIHQMEQEQKTTNPEPQEPT